MAAPSEMTQSTSPTCAAQQQVTSAAAWEGKSASAYQEGAEGVDAPTPGTTIAKQTSQTARKKDVDAACEFVASEVLLCPESKADSGFALALHDQPASTPKKYHVQSLYGTYEVFGVDAIWHNQYAGPDSDFIAIRKQFDCDINLMIMKVVEHVRQGIYTVISMNATPHMLTVICACEKFQADFPEDMWDDPCDIESTMF